MERILVGLLLSAVAVPAGATVSNLHYQIHAIYGPTDPYPTVDADFTLKFDTDVSGTQTSGITINSFTLPVGTPMFSYDSSTDVGYLYRGPTIPLTSGEDDWYIYLFGFKTGHPSYSFFTYTSTLAPGLFGARGGTFQASPVPEPASWAMMLGGFGLLGSALRRRRVSISYA